MDVTDADLAAIRECAYFKWLDAGAPPSDGIEYWLASECEYLQRIDEPSRQSANTGSRHDGPRTSRTRPRADKEVLIGSRG